MKFKPAAHLANQLRTRGIGGWVQEHRFHPTRRWRFDFAWPELRLAVEVHGAVHTGGRHTRGAGFTRDREKMNEAQLAGWLVLEVAPSQVESLQAVTWILQAIQLRSR